MPGSRTKLVGLEMFLNESQTSSWPVFRDEVEVEVDGRREGQLRNFSEFFRARDNRDTKRMNTLNLESRSFLV